MNLIVLSLNIVICRLQGLVKIGGLFPLVKLRIIYASVFLYNIPKGRRSLSYVIHNDLRLDLRVHILDKRSQVVLSAGYKFH